jgi:hypothetical protein
LQKGFVEMFLQHNRQKSKTDFLSVLFHYVFGRLFLGEGS